MIVDDQPPFRDAARAVVSRVAGFDLVAEVESGEEAVATSGALRPDLVLMDINMGALDGIEATRMITDAHPQTKVILVSTYGLDDLPGTARSSGAMAYVNKDELSPRVAPPPVGVRWRRRLARFGLIRSLAAVRPAAAACR